MLFMFVMMLRMLRVMSLFNAKTASAPDAYADKLQVLMCMTMMMLMLGPNAKLREGLAVHRAWGAVLKAVG